MKSNAKTPAAYVAALPDDRRKVVSKLRSALRKNLPKGFEETMAYGMLAYVVPHRVYPDGYHTDPERPLPFINLASQKRHVALYHMGLYDGPLLRWFEREWPKHTDARFDVGKCCVRMQKLDAVPFALIGELATKMTTAAWIDVYERARGSRRARPAKHK